MKKATRNCCSQAIIGIEESEKDRKTQSNILFNIQSPTYDKTHLRKTLKST